MTNLTMQTPSKNEVESRSDMSDVTRAEAARAFTQLTFLDNADLVLIGGGGAHGGNCL